VDLQDVVWVLCGPENHGRVLGYGTPTPGFISWKHSGIQGQRRKLSQRARGFRTLYKPGLTRLPHIQRPARENLLYLEGMSPRVDGTPPLSELRRRYVDKARPLPVHLEALLRADQRPAAQGLLAAIERRRRANRSEGQRLRGMLRFETSLWGQGVLRVAGVDEAGMSPLAGPVAAGAVVFAPGTRIAEVDDCKRLDPATRERLAPIIRKRAVAWAVAFVEHDEIDRLNIYWAGVEAMKRALAGLGMVPDHVLIDGPGRGLKDLTVSHQGIVGGDQLSLSIAAASILAKTARDARMRQFDTLYPGYGLGKHKGYPVKEHLDALTRLGPCPIHRRSFAPVREAAQLSLPMRG
jgi:ribonuclease HII